MADLYYSALLLFLGAWAGGGTAFLLPSDNNHRSRLFLSFSGAFLFALGLTEFFPTLFQEGPPGIGIWVLLGFLLQILLEVLSGGVEHGHVQKGHMMKKGIPFAALVGLSIHALMESIPLGGPGILNSEHFLMGLLVHKLPVSLALASLLLNSSDRRAPVVAAFSIFSLMGPLGIFIGNVLPERTSSLPTGISYYILAIVLGVILHVSTTILFESSDEHRLEQYKLLAVLAGFALGVFF
ncbi:MAG: ZIP family metal transporter [Flavobacteriales bacterium]